MTHADAALDLPQIRTFTWLLHAEVSETADACFSTMRRHQNRRWLQT